VTAFAPVLPPQHPTRHACTTHRPSSTRLSDSSTARARVSPISRIPSVLHRWRLTTSMRLRRSSMSAGQRCGLDRLLGVFCGRCCRFPVSRPCFPTWLTGLHTRLPLEHSPFCMLSSLIVSYPVPYPPDRDHDNLHHIHATAYPHQHNAHKHVHVHVHLHMHIVSDTSTSTHIHPHINPHIHIISTSTSTFIPTSTSPFYPHALHSHYHNHIYIYQMLVLSLIIALVLTPGLTL